jgi:hypothetical protein
VQKELNNKISKPYKQKQSLVLNPNHGIKKSKTKTQCVHDVNAKRLYYKNMTRT